MSTSPRVPPQNLEAEQSVLGGVLYDNAALTLAIEHLKTGEEFYKPAHRLIYSAYLDLFEKGDPIDMMTVSECLKQKGHLNEAGGLDYLAHLMEMVPTAANVRFHSEIVLDRNIKRKLIAVCSDIVNRGYDDTETSHDLLVAAESSIFALEGGRSKGFKQFREVVVESIKEVEKLFERKTLVTGLPTGFSRLDELTAGMQNGDLIIMAGRPSMGKTAICINIAEYMAMSVGTNTAFYSLEMSSMSLALRMISSVSGISMHKIRTGHLGVSDWPKISASAQELFEAPLHIDDTAMQSVLDIRSSARRLKMEGKLDLIIIDYLQLMHSREKVENRALEISAITRGLKAIARDLNVPVIAISQLSRKVEERPNKRPMLSDLRESGAIEQDADLVMFVYREEYYNRDKEEAKGRAEVIIAKQRNGPTGSVYLAFNNECTRFDNLAPADVGGAPANYYEPGE